MHSKPHQLLPAHTQRKPPMAIVLLLVFAVALLGAPTVASAASTNQAATLRWPGYVDTDLESADFFAFEHTIMARFMLQHPRAYRGPIISFVGRNDSFQIGQGDFRSGAYGPKLGVEGRQRGAPVFARRGGGGHMAPRRRRYAGTSTGRA